MNRNNRSILRVGISAAFCILLLQGCPLNDAVDIPGGCFYMGDSHAVPDDGDTPIHEVCISDFQMDTHEVSNAKYADCVASGNCTAPAATDSDTRPFYYGNPAYADYPVIHVTWFQAQDYCNWRLKRLPSEAEWEYAARGTLERKKYPWGDVINGGLANYNDSGDPEDNDTNAVGSYPANDFGLYDMSGNVWEWVNDWWDEFYYSSSPLNDPQGPAAGVERVLRSGSFANSAEGVHVAHRVPYNPASESEDIGGFRCAAM